MTVPIPEEAIEKAARGWVDAQLKDTFNAVPSWDSPLTPEEYRRCRRKWAHAALLAAAPLILAAAHELSVGEVDA